MTSLNSVQYRALVEHSASVERQLNRFSKMGMSLSEVSRLEAGGSLAIDAATMDIWRLLRDTVETHDEALRARSDQPHTLTIDDGTTVTLTLPVGGRGAQS